MSDDKIRFSPSRRDALRMIGLSAGGAAMYQAMTALGFAAESRYQGPVDLAGTPKGASVLILGAGMAGMAAAYELRNAGYKVQVLEYNNRRGGRNWSLRGGDTFTEMGGATQRCEFDKGLYINPGPWRLPYHHQNMLHYCQLLGIQLEPFVQVNYNAHLHSQKAFDGKPQRYRAYNADYRGTVSDLLAKSVAQHGLDAPLTSEDREKLLASLQPWSFLDDKYRYVRAESSSASRGYDRDPGGGLAGKPVPSQPLSAKDVLNSQLWQTLFISEMYEFQMPIFQPVGGMGRIGEAFGKKLDGLIRYNAKVTRIAQDDHGVTAHYEDVRHPGTAQQTRADWCICTIPLSILSQIPMNVGDAMTAAIAAVPYAASTKIGLQFKRRFWEQDEHIYGGISYTDLPVFNISYPSTGFFDRGPGVLLGAYNWGPAAFQFAALSPAERVKEAVRLGSKIHPQYAKEFQKGVAVAWHRSPFTMGCFGKWTENLRDQHYNNLCKIDGRIAGRRLGPSGHAGRNRGDRGSTLMPSIAIHSAQSESRNSNIKHQVPHSAQSASLAVLWRSAETTPGSPRFWPRIAKAGQQGRHDWHRAP